MSFDRVSTNPLDISPGAALMIEQPARGLHDDVFASPPRPNDGLDSLRQKIVRDQTIEWELGETLASLYLSAKALKKFGVEVPYAAKLTPAGRRTMNARASAASFTTLVGVSAAELLTDRLFFPNECKSEATVVADWLVAPLIAATPGTWKMRAAWCFGTHMLGRTIDHFRRTGGTSWI